MPDLTDHPVALFVAGMAFAVVFQFAAKVLAEIGAYVTHCCLLRVKQRAWELAAAKQRVTLSDPTNTEETSDD